MPLEGGGRRSENPLELLVRAPLLLLLSTVLSGLAAPSVGAQGVGAIASTRVTVVVPERAGSRATGGSGSRWSEGLPAAASTPEVTGRNDLTSCSQTLDIGSLGSASVSCLETVEFAGGPAGVAIELDATRLPQALREAMPVLQLELEGGTVMRLPMRPYTRAGKDIVRTTLPAHAMQRLAAAPRIVVRLAGVDHALSEHHLAGLRRLATQLHDAPVHREQARR